MQVAVFLSFRSPRNFYLKAGNKMEDTESKRAKQILPRPQSKEQASSYQSNCQKLF